MKALEQNKNILVLGVIILIAFFMYNSFFADLGTPDVAPAQSVGADLVKLSDNLAKATLDQKLFGEGPYRALADFSTPLQPQPFGRANPFAPIGQ